MTPLRDDDGRVYRSVQPIRRGVAGELLVATADAAGRTRSVSLHVLPRTMQPDDPAVHRLRGQLDRLSELRHPAIPSPQDVVVLDGDWHDGPGRRVAVVTGQVDGPTLDTLILGRDPLPRGPLLDVVEQIADALHVAWAEYQVAHGNLQAGHIRIGPYGGVDLLDFGVAQATRLAHDDGLRPSTDIYALGCILVEGWTRTPFTGDLDAHPARATLGPVEDLVRGMLAVAPSDRPGALAVAVQCDRIASGLPTRHSVRRWAREQRVEARPTERVATVDSDAFGSSFDPDAPTSVTLPARPIDLGPETPPVVRKPSLDALRPGPVDPRPDPAPLSIPPAPSSQATTRWMARVSFDEDDEPPRRQGGLLVMIGAFLLAGGGVVVGAAYLLGIFDALRP